MRIVLGILAGVAGAVIGAALGFFLPYLACLLVYTVSDSEFAKNLMMVGWIFCMLTVPGGAFYGAVFSFYFVYRLMSSE